MRIILVPGFWLDASAWDRVVPGLEASGHHVTALTLPGMTAGADRSAVTLQDHVDAVIAAIDAVDASEGPVALVGHSGGASLVSGAADARPDRVARIVYVDSVPAGAGTVVNDELPVVDGEIPLPDWEVFGESSMQGLDETLRADFIARAIPTPVAVAQQPLHVVNDAARRAIPVTVITSEMTSDELRGIMSPDHDWHGYVRELTQVEDFEIIDLPTGHWPMFSEPDALAGLIAASLARHRAV